MMRVHRREVFLFIVPGFAFLILFSIYPAIFTWYTSFRDYSIFSNAFVGLRNYFDLLGDNIFF
ncbi:MAG: sugar ABC transporter permease, partial [Atribacterota bacterium]